MSIENRVFLTGVLTEDNDLRDNIIVDGKKRKLLKNRLSIKSQEWGEDTAETLVDIKIWDEEAERIASITKKGDKISVWGELRQSFLEFDEEEGLRRCGVCVHAKNVKVVFGHYYKKKRKFAYEIDLTATQEIFESEKFMACYYIRRLGEDGIEYAVYCEDKNDKENYRNKTCKTKAEIVDFIKEHTDIEPFHHKFLNS